MITTEDLARTYSLGARVIYVKDGFLVPIMALHGGPESIIITLSPERGFHPSDQLCAIAFAYGSVTPATHLITVTETWQKAYAAETEEEAVAGSRLQRGELEAMAKGGDTSVHTALLVTAIDLKDPPASQIWTTDVDEDTEASMAFEGIDPEWSMPSRIYRAWVEGTRTGPPREAGKVTWREITDLMVATKFVESAHSIQETVQDLARGWN